MNDDHNNFSKEGHRCGGCEKLVYGSIYKGWLHEEDGTLAGSKCIEVWRKTEMGKVNFMKELERL